MSKSPRSHSDPGVLAILHLAAGRWRGLVASRSNGRLRIIETRRFAAAGDIGGWLEGQRASRVVTVLPSSSVVCRTCTLPDAAPADLEEALNLQAETHLLGTAEAHRIAVAVLEIAPGESSRTGIIVSWPESAPFSAPELPLPVTYAPDVAALAALLNGYRPAEPIFWADRSTGSVSLALTHAAGAVIRATREDGDTPQEWANSATRVLAETALSVGHSGAFAQSLVESHRRHLGDAGDAGAALLLPGEVIEAVSRAVDGAEATDEWWSEFGIATGVAMAATGELAPLTLLEGARAIEVPSRLDSLVQTLSRPRAAVVTSIVCLLAIALLPLAASGARLAMLRRHYPDIEQRTKAIDQTEAQLAMYSALESQTWSMTKLLADVVSNTPQGIELDSVRLQHTDESVFVSGRAVAHEKRTATEVIAQMQELMRDSGLFGEIKLNWDEPNNFGNHEFELSARVVAPHHRVKYDIDRDFATWTLAQRQSGEEPSEMPAEAVAADDSGDAAITTPERLPDRTPGRPAGATPTDSDSDSDSDAGSTHDNRSERPSASAPPRTAIGEMAPGTVDPSIERDTRGPAPGAVPAPLSKAQIDAMTLQEASAALVEVAKAKNRLKRDDDPELYDRLTNEFKMLMARKREGL